METKKRLLMTFMTSDDKKVSLSVDEPRANVTEAEIKAAMDLVVAKNIFRPSGANFVGVVDAKVVETDTVTHDLVIG